MDSMIVSEQSRPLISVALFKVLRQMFVIHRCYVIPSGYDYLGESHSYDVIIGCIIQRFQRIEKIAKNLIGWQAETALDT
jgi:hypothetical protein